MRIKKNSGLLTGALIGIIGTLAIGTSAIAGCYFVACPNQPAQPQYQPQVQYQQAPPQSAQKQYSDDSDDSYSSGYSKGFLAGKKAAHSQKAKKSSHGKISKKSSKTYYSKSAKATPAKTNYVASKPGKKKTVYYSNSAVKPNYSYNSSALQDSAKIYGSNQYGPSINVANFVGRGETWVSSSYKIISYTAPSSVQLVNGRQCGWGMPIASNGNIMKNNTWVCRCETGWRPENQ